MKKSELVGKLSCNLFGRAEDVDEAGAYMQQVIKALPYKHQADLWVALGVCMNTIANEIEKLED